MTGPPVQPRAPLRAQGKNSECTATLPRSGTPPQARRNTETSAVKAASLAGISDQGQPMATVALSLRFLGRLPNARDEAVFAEAVRQVRSVLENLRLAAFDGIGVADGETRAYFTEPDSAGRLSNPGGDSFAAAVPWMEVLAVPNEPSFKNPIEP